MTSNRIRTAVARGLVGAQVALRTAGSPTVAVIDVPRVDRAAGIIRGASAMQAVEALGHGVMVDERTLAQVAELGNANASGVKVRFTHPGMCSDGMGKLLGRMRDFRVEGDQVVGDIHLAAAAATAPDGDLRGYVMQLAEDDPEAFGMSVVVSGQYAWKLDNGAEVEVAERPANAVGDLPYLRVAQLHAVDVVDEPAANRSGLFSAGSAGEILAAFSGTTNDAAATAFAQLDQLREQLGLTMAQAESFLARYFAARRNPITAGAKPETTETTMKVSPARLAELCKANPAHVVHITERFAADEDEATILGSLAQLELTSLRAEAEKLRADLAAEQLKTKAEADAKAEALAKVAAAELQLSKLAGIATTVADPGPSGAPAEKPLEVTASRARSEGVDLKAVLADRVVVG